MWGTDMTAALTTAEGQAAVFFAVDHCSLEWVGIHAAKRGTRFEALEPLQQGVRESFGAFAPRPTRARPCGMTTAASICLTISRKS